MGGTYQNALLLGDVSERIKALRAAGQHSLAYPGTGWGDEDLNLPSDFVLVKYITPVIEYSLFPLISSLIANKPLPENIAYETIESICNKYNCLGYGSKAEKFVG